MPDIAGKRTVVGIPGHAALPGSRPQGCFFHPRCDFAQNDCREVFPPVKGRSVVRAADLLRKHQEELLDRVTRWSGLDAEEVRTLLAKLEDRADALDLQYRRTQVTQRIMDVTALATSLAMDFAYTGRFTG